MGEYFSTKPEKTVYALINEFYSIYNKPPSVTSLLADVGDIESLGEDDAEKTIELVEGLRECEDVTEEWLLHRTEKFCQEKAVYNALLKSISIYDGKEKGAGVGMIPELIQNALAVSFDNSVGHEYAEDASDRYDYYHSVEDKIPFDIDLLNRITKGGFSKKTLNIWLGGTGVGKTFIMCHCAADNFMSGKNVLYITMEMSEEEIGKRIDANLLGMSILEVEQMDKMEFNLRTDKVKDKSVGRLFIKEYPTASAGALEFRNLLNELKIKKNFIPDIIYIDYIGICKSSRTKDISNMYLYGKAISEELRGLGVEFNVAVVTAIQTNRQGFNDADVDLDSSAESFGVPMTADFMCAIMTNEQLESQGQYALKQLKNRYDNKGRLPRLLIGVDRETMKLYNLEPQAQNDLVENKKQSSKTAKKMEDDKKSRVDKAREILYDSIPDLPK